MSLTKSQVFYRFLNLCSLFSGFLYANLFFHAGDRYPVNILSAYFFLILLPLMFFILGFVARFRKKTEIFSLYRQFIEKVSNNVDTSLLKSEFHLNGLCFSLGGLASLLLKTLLTDIYFGWNFLFNLSPEFIVFFTDTFSIPWSWIWSGAQPSVELISQTQFTDMNLDFYLDQIQSSRSMEDIGDWRAFFVASYFFYAFVPRVILWGYHFKKRVKI